MQKRRRSSTVRLMDPITFLHCRESPSHTQVAATYTYLSTDPRRLCSFIADDETRATLQADFERGAGRIVLLLRFGLERGGEQGRANDTARLSLELLEYLLAPLLTREYDDFVHMKTLIELFCCAVELNCRYRKGSWMMTTFAEHLLGKSGFLEALVSDMLGYQAVVRLLESLDLTTSVPERLARRFAQLAADCPAGHRIDDVLARWYALNSVYSGLKSLEVAWNAIREKRLETAHLNTRVLRQLNPNDKKERATHPAKTSEAPEFPTAPAPVVEKIGFLGMQVPESGSQLLNLLEVIRNEEIPTVLKQIVASFPCRECLSSGKVAHQGLERGYWKEGLDMGEGRKENKHPLFGKRVGVWKVLFSAQALQLLRDLSYDGRFSQVESRLLALASGRWVDSRMFTKAGTPEQRKEMLSPLLLAVCDKDLKILWQVDVGYHEEEASYCQLVKVWTVGGQVLIDKGVEEVLLLQQRYGVRVELGHFRKPLQDGEGKFIPRIFPASPAFLPSKHPPSAFGSDRRIIELSNKFYAFTEPVLKAFTSGDLYSEFPFDISEEEVCIIKHFTSGTLILGRSGTGKTTCLLYQLLRGILARRAITDGPSIRQILVTRSPFLASKLNGYLQRLLRSQFGKAALGEAKGDVSGSESYGHDITVGVDHAYQAQSLLKLPESAYPLVCSFDQLLTLIGNTLREMDRRDFLEPNTPGQTGNRRAQRVDYGLFKTEYWAKLPVAKGMVPALVFSTIMGVIKGSASSENDYAPLTRAQYMALSTKLTPTFASEKSKNQVYDIFESYERIKTHLGDHDVVDRVRCFLLKMKDDNTRTIMESIIEEVYVDEIQDQTSADIVLLLQLVRNPRGIHMAGDTAQNISKDSTFRFQDVKKVCYNQFAPAFNGDSTIATPEMFTLYRNYRSHQGIIGLASFIMKLLYDHYPNTVDKLPPEESQLSGPRPLIFSGFGADIVRRGLEGVDTSSAQSAPDFGAEQVVLVRDEETKNQVQGTLQDSAIVLTILDSKGMEFDDVLLLDFFSTTVCAPGFRQLLKALKEGGEFDSEKHSEMCSELKNLYVAVTRPRSRLWLVESIETAVAPVISILTECLDTPLIEVVESKDPNLSYRIQEFRPIGGTDPARFSERGFELLRRHLYQEALVCFRNARDTKGIDIVNAHIHVEKGRNARGAGNTELFHRHFCEAIELFRGTDLLGNAANCLEDIGRLFEAAQIWEDLKRLEHAAELYIRAGKPSEAVRIFHAIGNYEKAAAALLRSEQYNEFARYITQNSEGLPQAKYESYIKLCMMLLRQEKIRLDMAEVILDALGSDSTAESFFKTLGMKEELARHYEKRGTSEGRKMALQTLISAGKLEEALKLIIRMKGEDVEETIAIQMVHYHKARLFSNLGVDSRTTADRITYSGLPDHISSVATEWENFMRVFRDHSVAIEPSGWSPVFCPFFTKAAISHAIFDRLPSSQDIKPYTASANAMSGILRDLTDQQRTPEYATPWFIFMGLYPSMDNPGEVMVLDYSPIRGKVANSCDFALALEHSIPVLTEVLSAFVRRLDDFAKEITKRDACRRCRMRLPCDSANEAGKPPRDHRWLVAGDCAKVMNVLLNMGDMYAQARALYFRRVFKDPDPLAGEYRGAQRRWMERVLSEILYPSHYTNSSEVSMQAVRDIVGPNGQFHGLMVVWEELLFRHLSEKLTVRPNITSIMTELLLCDFLDHGVPRPMRRKGDYLLRRAIGAAKFSEAEKWCLLGFRSLNRLWNASKFKAELREWFRELRRVLAVESSPEMQRVRAMESFSEMHSFLFALEGLTTQLIWWGCCQNSGIILPKSWIELHMPSITFNPTKVPSEILQQISAECLVGIVTEFSGLLRHLDTQFIQETYSYTLGTKKGGDKIRLHRNYLEHRLTALLTIPMLNVAELLVHPVNIWHGWDCVQRAFHTKMVLPHAVNITTPNINTTAPRFYNSYAAFGDKEYLVMVNTGSGRRGRAGGPVAEIHKLGNYRTDFVNRILTGAQQFHQSRPEHQSPGDAGKIQKDPGETQDESKASIATEGNRYSALLDHQEEEGNETPKAAEETKAQQDHQSPEDVSETRGELKAAIIIQKFWREHYPVLLSKRREEAKTPRGAAKKIVESILRKVKGVPTDIADCLRTTAVNVYVEANDVRRRLREALNTAKKLLDDKRTTTDTLTKLTPVFDQISSCKFETEYAKIEESVVRNLIAGMVEATDLQKELATGRIVQRYQAMHKETEKTKAGITLSEEVLATLVKAEAERRMKEKSSLLPLEQRGQASVWQNL